MLERCIAQLNGGKPVRALGLGAEEERCAERRRVLHHGQARDVRGQRERQAASTQQPAAGSPDRIRQRAATRPCVAICAAIESEIVELDDAEQGRTAFLADMGMEEPGLNRLIRGAFKLLGLQTYFTAGVKEVRAWTIHDRRHRAAGGRRYPHRLLNAASSARRPSPTKTSSPARASRAPKEAGKMRAEGKEYVVQDGDVMNFLFNV